MITSTGGCRGLKRGKSCFTPNTIQLVIFKALLNISFANRKAGRDAYSVLQYSLYKEQCRYLFLSVVKVCLTAGLI